jgi:hypothetical protein
MTVRYSTTNGTQQLVDIPKGNGLATQYREMLSNQATERRVMHDTLLAAGWVVKESESGEYSTFLSPALVEAVNKGVVTLDQGACPEQLGWDDHYLV